MLSFKTKQLLLGGGALLLLALAWPAWKWGSTQNSLSAVRAALRQREFDQAIEKLKKLEPSHPKNGEIPFLLAVAHRRSDRPLDAQRFLQRAEELGYSPSDIERERNMTKFELGDILGTEEYLRQLVVQGAPSDDVAEELYESLVKGYSADHRFNDALLCIEYWLEWRTTSLPPRLRRAAIYEHSHLWALAIDDYRQILELAPDHAEAHFKLAQDLLRINNVEEAQAEFERCRAADPKNAEALLGLAKCLARQGTPEAAEKLLNELQSADLKPQMRAMLFAQKGELALPSKDYASAITNFKKSLEQNPHQSAVHYSLAKALEIVNKNDEAREHFEESRLIRERHARIEELSKQVNQDPNDAELRFEIGRLLGQNGFAEDAMHWMTRALRINPQHAGAHLALAEFFTARGDFEMARRHRQAAADNSSEKR